MFGTKVIAFVGSGVNLSEVDIVFLCRFSFFFCIHFLKHDIIFEPWEVIRIRKCLGMLIELVDNPECNNDKELIRKKAKEKV